MFTSPPAPRSPPIAAGNSSRRCAARDTDGAPGLIRAVEECLPTSLRQRCLAHKMRNIAVKLPEDIHAEFIQAARAAYQALSSAMAQA